MMFSGRVTALNEEWEKIHRTVSSNTASRVPDELEELMLRASELIFALKTLLLREAINVDDLQSFRKIEWEAASSRFDQVEKITKALVANFDLFSSFPDRTRFYWSWKMIENYFVIEPDKKHVLHELFDKLDLFFGLSKANIHRVVAEEKVDSGPVVETVSREASETTSAPSSKKKGIDSLKDNLAIVKDVKDKFDHNISKLVKGTGLAGPRKSDVSKEPSIPVLVLGDVDVGKTALCNWYCDKRFSKSFSTIGVISRQAPNRIRLFDTGGQKEFRYMLNSYMQRATAVFIVFDVTNRKSFDGVRDWIKAIRDISTNVKKIILVANKTDVVAKRVVSTDEAKMLAKSLTVDYTETSAKEGSGIEEAFMMVTPKALAAQPIHKIATKAVQIKGKESDKTVSLKAAKLLGLSRLELGFLEKRGYWATAYKARWFVLNKNSELEYYDGPLEKESKGAIPLKGSTIQNGGNIESRLDADFQDKNKCVVIKAASREFRLRAESEKAVEHWVYLLTHTDFLNLN